MGIPRKYAQYYFKNMLFPIGHLSKKVRSMLSLCATHPANFKLSPQGCFHPFISNRVLATLSAHSRPPAMASLREFPCPPTSTRMDPGHSC